MTRKRKEGDGTVLIITDVKGNAITYCGPTHAELRKAHEEGKCGSFCGFCYTEACKMMDDLGM